MWLPHPSDERGSLRWDRAARAAVLATTLLLCAATFPTAQASEVHLSSDRNPISLMRSQIRATTDSVEAVLYKFDEGSLEKSLRDALKRGVRVRIVADADEARRERSQLEDLQRKGARIRLWKRGKLHAKLAILDGRRVVTGSFNWTESAQHENMELIIVSEEPDMVKRCQEIFEQLWDHADSGKL